MWLCAILTFMSPSHQCSSSPGIPATSLYQLQPTTSTAASSTDYAKQENLRHEETQTVEDQATTTTSVPDNDDDLVEKYLMLVTPQQENDEVKGVENNSNKKNENQIDAVESLIVSGLNPQLVKKYGLTKATRIEVCMLIYKVSWLLFIYLSRSEIQRIKREHNLIAVGLSFFFS